MNEREIQLSALAEARGEAERLRELLKIRGEQLERVCLKANELADRHEAVIATHAVEAEAAEAMLGAAMDAALQGDRS
jgi:hypothetical protein